MMLLHQQSITVDEIAKVIEDYAEMVGDKSKQQKQDVDQNGASLDDGAAAAAEAQSIRALASVLK